MRNWLCVCSILFLSGSQSVEVQIESPRRVAYDYSDMYEQISPSIAKVFTDTGHGSRFLVDATGLIATNQHVVRNSRYLAMQRLGPREIMASMVDPAANFIWRSVSTTVTSQGTEEKAPQNESEWTDLRNAANLLAEGGRLLKKASQGEGDKDWLKWSQAVVDSATLTLEAIESENAEQVFEAGDAIYKTCVGCHGGYWRMSSP